MNTRRFTPANRISTTRQIACLLQRRSGLRWAICAALMSSLPLHAADSASATAADHATRNTQHAKPSPLTPEEEKATFTLPPGFEIELVASESEGIGKFVTVDWDQRGRMWSMTALEYPVDANENPAAAQLLYASKAKDKVLVWDTPFAPGPQIPRVFADGLAIPLGLLPYKDGVYVQHGTEIVFLSDPKGEGRASARKV